MVVYLVSYQAIVRTKLTYLDNAGMDGKVSTYMVCHGMQIRPPVVGTLHTQNNKAMTIAIQ